MKILLVDDESSLLKIGKIFLIKNNPNFDITGSHSAKDALKLLEKKSYDIIISDYQMPEMNGLEFLKEVKEKDSNIPFIMFTGKGREEVAIDALNLGANRYIQKGGDAKTQYGILSQAIINEYNHSFTQKKLVNSEEQYRTLVETMHDGIVSVDTSGVIEFVNEKFCKMIGYSTEELLYTNITNYYDEENQRIVREQLNLRTKGTAKPYEIEWTKKNGDKIITINSPNILYNKDDEHVGSFSVIKDVAELKRVKTALSQREKELIYQSKLDALLADISTRSINLEYDKTDQEIVHILQKMCEFFMFDSGVITRYHNDIRDVDETYFTNTHEYIRGHDPNR
ncbi:MAG: response regulator, partial [Candidatus Heimdallarchaeota archaeon]|nr:response regulator [Candidatus Heimdallarchaeota archaeon]MCK5048162.1 response regulator [Candidatus Heimdallarchaeota archaeon]